MEQEYVEVVEATRAGIFDAGSILNLVTTCSKKHERAGHAKPTSLGARVGF
jgi:hypothetical protein